MKRSLAFRARSKAGILLGLCVGMLLALVHGTAEAQWRHSRRWYRSPPPAARIRASEYYSMPGYAWPTRPNNTYSDSYPRYIGGFHARYFDNYGVPSGDIGLRGNGIYMTPW